MSVLVFCGADGGVGVTTSLVAIGAHWRTTSAAVVEMNRRGGNLAAWAGIPDNVGTATLSAACWNGNPDDLVSAQWGTLSNGLPVLCGPTRQAAGSGVVDYIAAKVLHTAAHSGSALLVDAGTLDANNLPQWINTADAIVVVAKQDPRSAPVTGARLERVAELVDATRSIGIETFALTVGEQPFKAREVASFLDVTTVTVVCDPIGAALLTRRDANPRSVGRCALVRSALEPAERLAIVIAANPIAASI